MMKKRAKKQEDGKPGKQERVTDFDRFPLEVLELALRLVNDSDGLKLARE